MIKLYSIASDGKILVDDGKTGREATAAECSSYGYDFRNGSCYAHGKQTVSDGAKNKVLGSGNVVTSSNNSIIGKGNRVRSSDCNIIGNNNEIDAKALSSTIIGANGRAFRHGEIVKAATSSVGRTQKSVLMFEGRTVNSSAATELYLANVTGHRFCVDEKYNRSVLALDIHSTFKKIDSTQATCGYMHSNACFQSTAGVLAINGSHTSLFATAGMSTSVVVLTATSGTPDYIKVHVVGDRTMTQDWSVVINVYEIKTTAV